MFTLGIVRKWLDPPSPPKKVTMGQDSLYLHLDTILTAILRCFSAHRPTKTMRISNYKWPRSYLLSVDTFQMDHMETTSIHPSPTSPSHSHPIPFNPYLYNPTHSNSWILSTFAYTLLQWQEMHKWALTWMFCQ